jgi:hypothetical protein
VFHTVRQHVFSSVLLCHCLFAASASASAQSSDYCDKVRAQAKSEAARLVAPKLFGQALRFPTNADVATNIGPGAGRDNYQLRFGLSYSPIDLFRGLRTVSASDADCEAHIAADSIEQAIDDAPAAASLSAYRAQAAFLEGQRAMWSGLLATTEARLNAQMVTQLEMQQVRQATDALERELLEAHAQVADLEARGVEGASPALDQLEHSYVRAETERERKLTQLKALSGLSLGVSGGALVPLSAAVVDWFGWIELSYNLGSLVSSGYDSDYLKARAAELRNAHREISQRVQTLKQQLSAQREYAQRELALFDKQLSLLDRTLAALGTVDATATAQARDLIALERLTTQAEATRLRALTEALQWLGSSQHHE